MQLMAMQRAGAHAPAVEECISIVDQTIRQIRNLALELRPLALDDLGLADALESALERQAKAAGWETSMQADELPTRLPPQIETACFRIGQEALTNIARHAAARTVRVELQFSGDELVLDIQDDGKGFDYAASRSPAMRRNHFGLVSMTERANLAGGQFELFTAQGKGTRIRVTFPLSTWAQLL
jgi:signal transduction histidine kinase